MKVLFEFQAHFSALFDTHFFHKDVLVVVQCSGSVRNDKTENVKTIVFRLYSESCIPMSMLESGFAIILIIILYLYATCD